jgi:RNA polymerase sigma-70 factor (ECF subfamily)
MMDAHWQVACHAAIPVALRAHAHALASRAQFADYTVSMPCGLICAPDARSFIVDADLLASELDTHRRYLLRVAQLQLHDADLAEDVVQETLFAALAARAGFSGRSSVKTWLTGILKHKIVDAIRQKQRQPVILATFNEETDLDDFDPLFKDNGAWEAPPADWGDPENAFARQEFMRVMDACLDKLPPNTARVFMMREVMGLETDEICKELTITANNLWVILYRARMALRHCLEQNWFTAQPRP